MKSILTPLILIGAMSAFAAPKATEAPAQIFKADASSVAKFEATGRPSLMKIRGEGAKVSGEMKIEGGKAQGQFDADLTALTTGIDMRDQHMKERYLKTAENPKAVLKIESLDLPADWKPGQSFKKDFKGQLTLKGVTKPVEGTVAVDGEKLATEATFNIKLSDFDVGVPSYMGVTVADNVAVTVTLPAMERK